MRVLAALCSLLLLCGAGEPQWLTLPPTPSLPQAAQSGTAPVNGIKIWYAVFGQGEPVILLHGGLANADYWGHRCAHCSRITASSSWTAAATGAAPETPGPMATT